MPNLESMNEKAILVKLLEANFDITIKTQYFANVTNQEYMAHLKIHRSGLHGVYHSNRAWDSNQPDRIVLLLMNGLKMKQRFLKD